MGSSSQDNASQAPSRSRRVLRALGWLCASIVLFVAIALVAVRLLLPHVDRYRPELEALLSDYMGQTVSIGSLQAHWQGWNIVLRMRDVRLMDESGEEAVLHLRRTRLSVDPVESLRAGRLTPGQLVVSGASIAITRGADGAFSAQRLATEPGTALAPAAVEAERDAFASWILTQSELALESATIVWHDLGAERGPLVLSDVSLRTRFDGTHHRVDGAARLPAEVGGELSFDLDVIGDPTSRDWSGVVELRAERVNASALSRMHHTLGLSSASGEMSLTVSSHWEDAKLVASEVDFNARDLSLAWQGGESEVAEAAGHIELHRTAAGWDLSLEEATLTTAYGQWPPMHARVRFEREATTEVEKLSGELSFLRLQDVLPVLALRTPEKVRAALSGLGVRGDLEGISFLARGTRDDLRELALEARVKSLVTPARGRIPGLAGVSGYLQADLLGGRLALDSNRLELTLPGVFPTPLVLNTGTGALSWVRRGSGWWFKTQGLDFSNDDFSARLLGKLHWPYGNTLPILDLALAVDEANLARLNAFLPVGILRPRLAAWLERSIKGGRLHDGQIQFRGYAGDFPFNSDEGSLSARGKLSDVELDYSPRWPKLEGLQSDITLTGPRLEMKASGGTVFGSVIRNAVATIADLRDYTPTMEVKGHLRGSAQNGLEFLRESPLKDRFQHLVQRVEAEGDIDIDLELDVPLPHGDKIARGQVHLAGNTLNFQGVGVLLEDVQGELEFSPKGVSGTSVSVRYLDEPALLDVGRMPEHPKITRVRMSGTATRAFLIKQLHAFALFADPADPPRVLSHLNGATEWEATLDLPDGWGESADSEAPLRVESTLRGLEIDLPAPFHKPGEVARVLRIDTALSRATDRSVAIRYGTDIGTRFAIRTEPGGGYRLIRGSVVFGDPAPELPANEGLHIGGRIEALSIDRWAALVTEEDEELEPATPPGPDQTYPILRVLTEIEIRAAKLEVLGHSLDNTHLMVGKDADGNWTARASGDSVDGLVTLPISGESQPLVVTLDRLKLKGREEDVKTEPGYDPSRLPPMRFTCKHCTYDDLELGTVKLSTTPQPHGLKVDTLYLISDSFESNSVGSWTFEDGRHLSKFVTEVHSDDLGKLLAAFGFEGGGSSGGATDVLLNTSWEGTPSQFSLSTTKGVLHFRASRGRLTSVARGATGRAFGLLMITSLPRRLLLDFSDLFAQGVAYDLIEGSFAIDVGNAYTNNLLLESEPVRIEIAGRTGLVAEDYDQTVTITPKLSSSLPLAPIWLIEKFFKKKLFDKVFSFQYTITGSWDDPVVEPIIVESEAQDSGR